MEPTIWTPAFAFICMQIGIVCAHGARRFSLAFFTVLRANCTCTSNAIGTNRCPVAIRTAQFACALGRQEHSLLALCAPVRSKTGVAWSLASLANSPNITFSKLVVAIWALVITPIGVGKILSILAFVAGGRIGTERAVCGATRARSAHLASAKSVETIWAAFFAFCCRRQVSLVLAFSGIGCIDTSLHVTRTSRTSVASFCNALSKVTIWARVLASLIGSQVGVVLAQIALPLTKACNTGWRANLAKPSDVLGSFVVVTIWTLVRTGACMSQIRRLCTLSANRVGLA